MLVAVIAACLAMQLPPPPLNALTPKEMNDGWILLFDGQSTKGWHSFRHDHALPGWQVKDGVLTSVDPGNAGDLLTDQKFQWFELSLDYNLPKDQNSGIMFHVVDEGDASWMSGPEIQIYDDHGEPGAQKTGWLYELYSSKVDSTHPVGQWNHFRIVIAPHQCATYVNGVKYYEFVLGSDDFWARVAKSKFAGMPLFAKQPTGSICIQGDHGVVSFRNIKVKPL